MAAPYSINIVNGTGTSTVGIPNATYDITLGGSTLAYGATLYDSTDAGTRQQVTEAVVTSGDQTFTYYVEASGKATIRLVDNEGNPITDSATTGVRFRRTVTVGTEKKCAGSIKTLTDGAVVVEKLPFNGAGTGPDVVYEIDTDSLTQRGYSLVDAGITSIAKKITSENEAETYFDFKVQLATKTVNIFDSNAGLADTFDDETAPTAFYGIETSEFTFDEQQP